MAIPEFSRHLDFHTPRLLDFACVCAHAHIHVHVCVRMCLYGMYIHVYVLTCASTHAHVFVCIWNPEANIQCVLYSLSILFFEIVSHWPWTLMIHTDWLASKPQQSSVSTSLVIGLEWHTPCLAFSADDGDPNSGPYCSCQAFYWLKQCWGLPSTFSFHLRITYWCFYSFNLKRFFSKSLNGNMLISYKFHRNVCFFHWLGRHAVLHCYLTCEQMDLFAHLWRKVGRLHIGRWKVVSWEIPNRTPSV